MEPRRPFLIAVIAVHLLLQGGCGRAPADSASELPVATVKLTAGTGKTLDILFVIDNSSSMYHEQSSLKQSFSRDIDALRWPAPSGPLPDLRIGVVSTDLGAGSYNLPSCETTGGDGGRLLTKQMAGCGPPADPWLSHRKGKTNLSSTSSSDPVAALKAAFNCMAQLGINGCGFEQPMEAARRALDPLRNVNPGFLRPDGMLAVVFVTDEDDCSAANTQLFDPSYCGLGDPLGPLTSFRCFEYGVQCECEKGTDKCHRYVAGKRINCVPGGKYLHSVDSYIEFFKRLKKTPGGAPDPGRVMLAAVAAPTDRVEVGLQGNVPYLKPSCQGAMGVGAPAIRIESLVHAFARKLTQKEIAGIKAGTLHTPHFVDAQGQWREENRHSICRSDRYFPVLRRIGENFARYRASPTCLQRPAVTTDGGLVCRAGDLLGSDGAGGQVRCKKSCLHQAELEVQDVDSSSRRTVPRCPVSLFDAAITADQCGSRCPCWRVIPHADCQARSDSSPYAVEVMRGAQEIPPEGRHTEIFAEATTLEWGSAALVRARQCGQ